jgi:hypothetical protein
MAPPADEINAVRRLAAITTAHWLRLTDVREQGKHPLQNYVEVLHQPHFPTCARIGDHVWEQWVGVDHARDRAELRTDPPIASTLATGLTCTDRWI